MFSLFSAQWKMRLCKVVFLFCILLPSVIIRLAQAAPDLEAWDYWDQANEINTANIDHSLWQQVLGEFLVETEAGINLVDYRKIANQGSPELEQYLLNMTAIDPREFSSIEQKAYWINLYNALTVDLIAENYPVSSITKLGKGFFQFGPWDDDIAEVAGQTISLNDIEHRILRPLWPDPRIHFGVNCASIGCPNLQPIAYTADNTNSLLDKAALEYVSHPRAVNFAENGRLQLSSIFDWYAEDFGDSEAELLHKLSEYAPAELTEPLRQYTGRISYDYDWSLNEL